MKEILRRAAYVLAVNLLGGVIMLLQVERVISGGWSLFWLIVLMLASIPCYFFVRADSERPLVGIILTLLSHALICTASCFAAGRIYTGWTSLSFYWLASVMSVYISLLAAVDLVITLIRKRSE